MIVTDFEKYIFEGFSEDGVGPASYDVALDQDVWVGTHNLASTVERFALPTDVIGIVHPRSTWARKGLYVASGVLEPGWRGHLTLELSAMGPAIHVAAGTRIAQILFHRLAVHGQYAGRYQDQERGPQGAR